MAKAPEDKPLIDIPGIETAKIIELRTRDRGPNLWVSLFVDEQLIMLNDEEWNDREWFSLLIRELDRRKIWVYKMNQLGDRLIYTRRDAK